MEHAKFVGRVGGLAVGLGIGSAMAALPWLAAADVTDTLIPDVASTVDVTSLLPAADAVAFTPNIAISFDGMSLLHEGNATASTVTGSFGLAIADGAGSNALSNGGMFGTAIANGADSSAYTNGTGNFVEATGYMSNAEAALTGTTGGNVVIADGAGSTAQVLGGNNDLVTVTGVDSLADTGTSNDIATIVGNSDVQAFTDGSKDIAAIFGNNSMATAGGGDDNLAAVFGNGSSAFAGLGNNDLAAAFGDGLSANAIGGNMTDIEPALTAGSTAAESLAGSDMSFLTDFLDGSWLTSLL